MKGELLLSRLLGLLPVEVKITGGKRNIVLSTGDWLYRRRRRRGGQAGLKVDGGKMILDVAQPNERLLLYALRNILRHYERSSLFSAMRKYLARGGTFVDVGANLGIYSYLAKTRIGAKTVCFEPEPTHMAFLDRNKVFFDEIYPFALSDSEGEASFFTAAERNPGAGSLVSSVGTAERHTYAGEIKVKVKRFDRVMENRADIGLIKIDVEGNEANTVRGMTGFFESGQTPPIWCEVRGPESDRNPNSYREVIETLGRFGYRPFVGEEGRPFEPEDDEVERIFDLLFIADGHGRQKG